MKYLGVYEGFIEGENNIINISNTGLLKSLTTHLENSYKKTEPFHQRFTNTILYLNLKENTIAVTFIRSHLCIAPATSESLLGIEH